MLAGVCVAQEETLARSDRPEADFQSVKTPLLSLRALCCIISLNFVGGCASFDVAKLQVGMTKEEVTAAMGKAIAVTPIEQTEYWEYSIAADDSQTTRLVNPIGRPFASPDKQRDDSDFRPARADGSYEERNRGFARRQRYMVVFKNNRVAAHGTSLVFWPISHNRPNSPSRVPFVHITRTPRGKIVALDNREFSTVVVYALPASITDGRVEVGYMKEKTEIVVASHKVNSSPGQLSLSLNIPEIELGKMKELKIFSRLQKQSEKDANEFKTVATTYMTIPSWSR